ncbi:MAG: VCBS repeat-containing protein [Planctomycetes bacterium]|nr:VCBS repeat-containing protein [Planctomycetota bacterium]
MLKSVMFASAMLAPRAQSTAVLTEMDFAEPVAAVFPADADGDGRKDAILLIDRRVEVHKLGADGAFSKRSDIIIKLPADVVAIDAAPLDPPGTTRAHPKDRLLLLTSRGVLSRALDDSTAAFEIIPLPSLKDPLAARAAGAPPIYFSFHEDFDGDGSPELLIPTGAGIEIFSQTADGWIRIGTARAPVAVSVDSGQNRPGSFIKQTFELPRAAAVRCATPSGAVEKLLSVSRGNDAWIYRIRDRRIEKIEHARGLFRFDNEDQFREARGTRRNEEINDRAVGLIANDLNGDGVPDFVSSRFRDGQVFITFGKPGEFGAETPDRVIDADGWVVLAQARDFNGDGRPDLIVPRLPKIGIAGALKALLSRKVNIDLWIYKNTGGPDVFSASPDWKHTFELDILLDGDEGKINVSTRLLAAFLDVNGDGMTDFVTMVSNDELAVFPGDRKEFIRDVPSLKIKIPSIELWNEVDLRGLDLNGDKREDFVIVYGSNRRGAKNKLLFGVWK